VIPEKEIVPLKLKINFIKSLIRLLIFTYGRSWRPRSSIFSRDTLMENKAQLLLDILVKVYDQLILI
jgi:hypothetical protein